MFFTMNNDNKKKRKKNSATFTFDILHLHHFPTPSHHVYISRGIFPSIFTLIQPLLLVLVRQLIQLNFVSRPAFFIRAETRGEAGVVPPEILPVLYGLGHRLVHRLRQIHGQETGHKRDETEENGGHFGIQRVQQHYGGCQSAA